jgi:hypothetical protein
MEASNEIRDLSAADLKAMQPDDAKPTSECSQPDRVLNSGHQMSHVRPTKLALPADC